jgi:serine/threonine protein kinase
MSLAAEDGLDTALARLLDRSGCVSREELVRALQEVRAGRGENPSLSLGAHLLSRGAVSAADLDQALAQLAAPAQPCAASPHQIGPYRVLRVLGAGGMGKVFAVEHVETGRREALKTVDVALDPDEAARFRREAEVLASLDHPGLIRIYGGEFESERPYLTLELCEGGSLQSRLRHGPLPPAEVLALAKSLGEALDYLHERGVLHRDLKPDNVLFDSAGRPKLTDFGLARVRGAQGLTATGEILGTPAYMAPEQAGRAHEAGPRSDVYGLAATLYAAATGQPPFVGKGLFEVLSRVLEDAPATPSALGVKLPASLEAGILRGLAKDPSDRPASASALANSLGEAEPVRLRAKAKWLLVGAGALVTCAALTWSALPSTSPRQTPSPTETPASSQGPALEALPPEQLWIELAEDSEPLPPAVVAHAWSAIDIAPPDPALESALLRRGRDARELVAYARLQSGRPPGPRCQEVLRWTDLDKERAALAEGYLTQRALREVSGPGPILELKGNLRKLTGEYLELIKAQPLPLPLMKHFVGRYQHTYLQARRALKLLTVAYGEGAEELTALRLATGGNFASVEAHLAYYFQAFNQDLPTAGGEGIPRGVELPAAEILDEFAVALFEIVHHSDMKVVDRQTRRAVELARKTGFLTKDIAPRALLTYQQRLWQQAIRDGEPEFLVLAREAQQEAADDWADGLHARRLRNGVVQSLFEGDPRRAREAFVIYDRGRKSIDAKRYKSFDQARGLFEGQVLLMEGKPAEALKVVRAARFFDDGDFVGEGPRPQDEFRLSETLALEAHAMKLLGQADYARFLRNFEQEVKRSWAIPAGLEWYLQDARGIIEGHAWWPGKGPFAESHPPR